MRELLMQLKNVHEELEKSKAWLKDKGHKLDPQIEADRYRKLVKEVLEENKELLSKLGKGANSWE